MGLSIQGLSPRMELSFRILLEGLAWEGGSGVFPPGWILQRQYLFIMLLCYDWKFRKSSEGSWIKANITDKVKLLYKSILQINYIFLFLQHPFGTWMIMALHKFLSNDAVSLFSFHYRSQCLFCYPYDANILGRLLALFVHSSCLQYIRWVSNSLSTFFFSLCVLEIPLSFSKFQHYFLYSFLKSPSYLTCSVHGILRSFL